MASEKLRKYLAYYQKVLREEPENIEARLRLAAIFREMGRKTHAVEEYVTASKLLARDGLPLEAIAACKAVLELDPTHTEIQYFLARLFAQVPEATGNAGRIARPLNTPQKEARAVVIPVDTRGFEGIDDELDAPIELKTPKVLAPSTRSTPEAKTTDDAVTRRGPAPTEHQETTRREFTPSPSLGLPDFPPEDDLSEITEVEDEEEVQHDPTRQVPALSRVREDDLFATQDIDPRDILHEAPEGLKRGPETTTKLPTYMASDIFVSVEPTETIELGVFDMSSLDLGEESDDYDYLNVDDLETTSESDFVPIPNPVTVDVKRSDLPEIPLFSRLAPDAFLDLLNVVSVRDVGRGEILVSPNDHRRSLFIIVKGEVDVWRVEGGQRIDLDTMGEGHFFGEFQLLTGRDGRATVSARSDVRLLELTEAVINGLGDRSPEVWDVLWEYFFRRMLNNLLATSQIFRGLTTEERNDFAARFEQREFLANDYVTREGEVNDYLFLVLTGEVVVERDLGGIRQTLAELREGEFLGIASTLAQEPYPADVRAVRDTVLLGLSGEAFRDLVDNHSQVAREVQKEMRKRRSLNSQFSSGITTYAELGITRED